MGLCGRLLLCAWGETPPLPLVGGSRGVLDGRRGGRVLRAARGTSSAPSGHLPQRGRQGRGCGRAGDLIRPFGAPSPEGKAGARLRPRGDLIRRLRRHLPQRGRQGRGCGRAGNLIRPFGAPSPEGKARARLRDQDLALLGRTYAVIEGSARSFPISGSFFSSIRRWWIPRCPPIWSGFRACSRRWRCP